MKVAIFVEGYTELAFVREFLLRHHEYHNIDVICQEIRGGYFSGTNYDFPNSNDFYDDNGRNKFLLVDCGGDQITSKILKREKYLVQNQFEKIIGLRDVYSLEFRKEVSSVFNRELVDNFINYNQEIINESSDSDITSLCFAIMEIESWYLGMPSIFEKKSLNLDIDKINSFFIESDPEEIFKPSSIIEEIYREVNEEYKKKGKQSDSLSNYPAKEDYASLYAIDICNSFNTFCDTMGIAFE